MKVKKILIDMVVVMASISLVSCMVLILSHNLLLKGIVSFAFDLSDTTSFMGDMTSFDINSTVGNSGILGIILSVMCIIVPCFVAYYQARNKHYYIGVGFLVPLLIAILPLITKDSVSINLLASFDVLLYINPYYSLLSILPFSIYIGYAIITLLVGISTVIGILRIKFKVNLD